MTPPPRPAGDRPAAPRDILLAVGVSTALLLASGWLSWQAGSEVDAALQALRRAHAMESASKRVLTLATDAETDQRGFVITGDRRYLQPYEAADAQLETALQELQQMSGDDVIAAPRVAALVAAAAAGRDGLRRTVTARIDEGFEVARATVLSDLSQQTMGEMRKQVAALTALAGSRASAALDNTHAPQRRAAAAGWATAALAMGATLGMVVFARRNRRVAAQVAAERERLRSVVDSMQAFVGVLAPDGTLIEANAAPLRAVGLQRDDVIGRKFWDCPWWTYDPAVQHRQRQAFERACAGETVRFDETIHVKDEGGHDALAVIDYTLHPVFSDGVLTMLVPSAVNISERVQAEQALRGSESQARERAEEMQALMAAVPVAVWTARDPLCKEIFGNPHSYQLLGMQQDANVSASAPGGLPQRRPFQEFRDGRRLDSRELPMQRAAREAVDVTLEEISFVFADGEVKHVLGSARPLRDADGRVRGAIAAFVEITDFRRAQEQLRQRDLQLREADRRKDEFLAMLAHELRNPLAPLSNGLQLLQQTSDPAVATRVREMMTRQLVHMVRLVDDLLDVSRITSDKVVLRLERLSLRRAAELAVESARPLIEAAGHTLVCDFPGEDLWVLGDLNRLAQVVGNLLTNAAKYTPRDLPGRGHITLRLQACDDQALISVSDNGLGIPPAMLDEVFGMFTQVNRTLDRAQGGLGIGLALVKALVQMHGGTVVAASEGESRGSVFTVTLPLLGHVEAPARRDPVSALAQTAAASRILVVDDNRDAADSLAALLATMGHTTRTAYSGQAALAAALDFDPDWVLLDIGLPDMDGHEVARALAADPRLSRARRVAVTGWGSDADRKRSLAAGFVHHLTKPVEPAALIGLLAGTPT